MKSEVVFFPLEEHIPRCPGLTLQRTEGVSSGCIRMHWWRSIAACRAQTCWVYLSLVFFLTWQSTAQHWRGTKAFWQRCIACTSSEGRAGCPEQYLGWWRESFLKCTDWRSLGRQGLAGSPPLGQAPQCLWLFRSPQLSCSPCSQPPVPAPAAAMDPTGSRWSCSGAAGCSAPLKKIKGRKAPGKAINLTDLSSAQESSPWQL